MESGDIAPLHSGLIPEALITLAHFSRRRHVLCEFGRHIGGIATAPSSARRFLSALSRKIRALTTVLPSL